MYGPVIDYSTGDANFSDTSKLVVIPKVDIRRAAWWSQALAAREQVYPFILVYFNF